MAESSKSPPCFGVLLKTSRKLPKKHTTSAVARAFMPRALHKPGDAVPDPSSVPARLRLGGNLPKPPQPEQGSFSRLLGRGFTPCRGCSAPARWVLHPATSPRCLSPQNLPLLTLSSLPQALAPWLPTARAETGEPQQPRSAKKAQLSSFTKKNANSGGRILLKRLPYTPLKPASSPRLLRPRSTWARFLKLRFRPQKRPRAELAGE